MKTQTSTQAIERPATLMERAPVAKSLDVPLVDIMLTS